MTQKAIFFIGGGNMAAAIIGGMDQNAWKITVAEIHEPTRQNLQNRFPQIKTVSQPNDPAIKSSDVIVLAVKPQSLVDVLASLKDVNMSSKMIVSIMAGIMIDKIRQGLKGEGMHFIRFMPNTPLLIKRGVTGVYPDTQQARDIATQLLGPASKLYYFKEEGDLDKVTAISGSGPAYFYAFIESLTKAGISLGFEPQVANAMAIGTALGAATLADTSTFSVAELRQQVTSKGGTTEAALNKFNANKLDDIVNESVQAALIRSQQLAKL